MKEIWKKIDEKEIYEVSNLGGFCNGIEKNYAYNQHDYKTVSFILNGEKKQTSLHRLVYTIFKGEIPKKMVINHKDGNKANNRIDNLECISQSDNIKHAYANNLFTTINYKENRGGLRLNSGRKKLNYKTKQMGVRVPIEIFEKCVEFCKKETKNFEKSLQLSK